MAQAVKDEKKVQLGTPEWYQSDEYKSLFPANDSEWIYKPLVHIKDNEKKYDGSAIDNFIPPDSKKPHKYFSVISDALDMFKKWNKWGVGKDGWVQKVENKDINHTGYIHEFPKEDIPATKEVIILPYNVAVVAGFLGNYKFMKEMDPTLDKTTNVETLSDYAGIVYTQTKLGIPFVSDRDFLSVDAIYDIGNGEMLIISRSLNDKNYQNKNFKPDKKYVRGTVELIATHLRPYYEKDVNQTIVTEYGYNKMNGSLPGWVVKQFSDPQLQKHVREYMDKNKKILAKPGMLHIPPGLLFYIDLKSLVEFYEKNKSLFKQ